MAANKTDRVAELEAENEALIAAHAVALEKIDKINAEIDENCRMIERLSLELKTLRNKAKTDARIARNRGFAEGAASK